MAKKAKEEQKPELPKLRFKADQKSPLLEIGHGEYNRKFKADEQPFEVENEEELRLLKGTDYFVEVSEKPAAAAITIAASKGKTKPKQKTGLPSPPQEALTPADVSITNDTIKP